MKKMIISIIFVIMIGLIYTPATVKAADSTENDIINFLNTDEGRKSVTEAINKSFEDDPIMYNGITGDIEISTPFSIPVFNEPTKSFYEMQYERYSICYCNDKAVGLIGFLYTGNGYMTVYYMLPDDFSCEDISLCFYGFIYDTNGNMLYGSSLYKTLLAVDKNKTKVAYYGKGDMRLRSYTKLRSLINDNFFQKNYSGLKKYNSLNEKSGIVCTLTSYENVCILPNVFSCRIINQGNGEALTYINGKYSMESICTENADSQIFIIQKNTSGYSIAPKSDTSKKIGIDKSTDINLIFSYHGQLICTFSGKNGSVLKVRKEKPVCGKYDFWDSSCDWILSEVA